MSRRAITVLFGILMGSCSAQPAGQVPPPTDVSSTVDTVEYSDADISVGDAGLPTDTTGGNLTQVDSGPSTDCAHYDRWVPTEHGSLPGPPDSYRPLLKRYSNRGGAEFYIRQQWGPSVGFNPRLWSWAFLDGQQSLDLSVLFDFRYILPTSKLWISLFIDYRQVDATFTRWIDERDGESIVTTDKFLRVDDIMDTELVDIRVAADELVPGRTHELGIMFFFDSAPTGERDGATAHILPFFQRRTIYNGGLTFAEPPCFAPALRSAWSATEEGLEPGILDSKRRGFVYLAEGNSHLDPWATQLVEPGHHEISLTVLGENEGYEGPFAAVLLANGRMVGDPFYVERGPQTFKSVSGRTSFRVPVTDTDNETEIFAVGWPDPFKPIQTLDGVRVEGVRDRGRFVTNTLRLRAE